MTCDQAIEFLPWLLNGTLEEQERAEVRRHLATCERCRQALAETWEAGHLFSQHLSPAVLVALAWGEEPPGMDRETAERHLASCPQCAAELELTRTSRCLEAADNLALFPSARPVREAPGAGRWRAAALAAGLTGLIAASGWLYTAQTASDLAERLAERERPSATPAAPAPAPNPAPNLSPKNAAERQRLAQMEAEVERLRASQKELAETAERAAAQLAQLENAPRGFTEPQINSWVNPVEVGDVVRSGAGPAKEIVIPSRQVATPLLVADPGIQAAEREIEILDSQGKVFYQDEGLRRSKDGDYSVTFPPGFLKPGRYTIQLYSREDGKRVPRETYKIRVE